MMGTFHLFGFSAENPMGVRVIWLVCAGACLLGFVTFIPYKVGDSQAQTKKIFAVDTTKTGQNR
jgi:hypothetical protein